MPSLVVIGLQMKERGGGGTMCPPAYMVPKDPSLNRVELRMCSSFCQERGKIINHRLQLEANILADVSATE